MVRTGLAAVLLLGMLVLAGCCSSRDFPPQCGDPSRESMSWRVIEGDVASVDAEGLLRLVNVAESFRKDANLTPRTVRIAGVDLDLPAARVFLGSLVGTRVSVWLNPRSVEEESVAGVVYRGKRDINHTLLLRGLGRYAEPPGYTVSSYTGCVHRLAAEDARTHRRGLWGRGD